MTDETPSEIIRENEESKKFRYLNFELNGSKFEEVDGGLLVKDVLALDEGNWTDSMVGTPLFYTTKALSEFAGNWKQKGFWNRHPGGSPRNLTDKVGTVKNPRFQNTGIYVDIYLPKRTQASRDMAEMILSGDANAVSIEHGGKEKYNKELGRWETESLTFYGLAAVDKGACETCMIRRNSTPEIEPSKSPIIVETVLEEVTKESEEMDKVEFDKALAELKSDFDTRLKAIEGSFSDAKAKSEKDLSEKMAEQEKTLAKYEDRIKALEKIPMIEKGLQGATPVGELRRKLESVDILPKK